MVDSILIRGARLHNLKNLSVSVPKNQLVVLTGLSGSGKSTLGLDLLLKEGQRQYLESLGILPYGYSTPPVESITGLSPAVSLDQYLTHQSPRSTVGTVTRVYTYLRVLYARLGRRPCPACGALSAPPLDPSAFCPDTEEPGSEPAETQATQSFPCPACGAPVPELSMAAFSFNKPEGACPACTGLGTLLLPNLERLADPRRSLLDGAVADWDAFHTQYHLSILRAAAAHYAVPLDLSLPIREFSPALHDLLFFGVESPQFSRHFPQTPPPRTVRLGRFEGLATALLRRYAQHIHEPRYLQKLSGLLTIQTCPGCEGSRLQPESRAVVLHNETIISLSRLPLSQLAVWLRQLSVHLSPAESQVAAPLLADLQTRLEHLLEVGVSYLTLERTSPSLSAGEAQRLRLASLLGSPLTGVLYVFDEPTLGLHPRDTLPLLSLLRRLRDLGNTVLVIEHDPQFIAAADHIIDLGPGAGKHGGQVVVSGPPSKVLSHPTSLTAAYLSHRTAIPVPVHRREPTAAVLTVHGARANNLKNLTVSFPLGLFIAVTGVSGSGKSTLVMDILDRALRPSASPTAPPPGAHQSIEGAEHIQKVITLDSSPLSRDPRSSPATYTDLLSPLRVAFASTPQARRLGLTPRHFSFNLPGGRCEHCQGAGFLPVSMHFLPDVNVLCPACRGRRFTPQVLSVEYNQLNIAQVLEMTVDEALPLFHNLPAVHSRMQALADIGLGYLQLAQPAPTLSGGEAQRLKLAKELKRRPSSHTLYLLDEPTSGLHLADTHRLLRILHRLVDAGSTVIVIEHNLDLIKTADWVIDLGPEGGAAGGQLVAQGTPEQVAQTASSYTGQALRPLLDKIS